MNSITLYDFSGLEIGTLIPLNKNHLHQNDLIDKLTNWRNLNMKSFLSHFVATPDRTRSWLENVVLKSNNQVFFLIYDKDNILIGHFGFKDLNSHSAMLDNAIRGERIGHPKLFVIAGKAIVAWLWENTTINKIYTTVLAENISAIMMNRQIGFTKMIRHPLLLKSEKDGNMQYFIDEEEYFNSGYGYCYKMWMERFDKIDS